jgi:hypothetical protein
LNVAYAFEKNCNFKNEIKNWWLWAKINLTII